MKWLGLLCAVLGIGLFVGLPQKEKVEVKKNNADFEGEIEIQEKMILKSFEEYKEINSEITFLLKFSEIIIPVVDSKDNDRYFRMNIFGEYDSMGTAFIDEISSIESENIIIQGHSSDQKEGVFSFIQNLNSNSNPSFKLISLDEEIEFEMLGITRVDLTKEDAWLGYYQQDFYHKEKERMLSQFLDHAFIRYRNERIDSMNQLITLVTCDVTEENSRFVIIAMKKG